MSEKIKVLVNGAMGRMGKVIAAGIAADARMELVAAVGSKTVDSDYGYICGVEPLGFGVGNDLKAAIEAAKPDVVVDFTKPAVVLKNIFTAVSMKTPIVVGTTGISADDYTQIEEWCKEYDTPVFIAPNFALGAVLLMKFSAEAAKYMPHVEVIERHHDKKLDAPSGTAVRTLEMMSANREPMVQGNPNEYESIPGSRGGEYEGMRVHSVRLPGYMATQEVIFGDLGQVLCLRHDALTRECYIPGVNLSIVSIMNQKGLVVGLDKLL